MNAQTVVDTFAPFVGTEGLRGIVSVYRAVMEDGVVIAFGDTGPLRICDPHIAHGFLLSRLAKALLLSESHWILCQDEGGVRAGENEGYRDVVEPDYPSAILAAARVEWPKRELHPVIHSQSELSITVDIAGKHFDFVVRDPQLVAAIRKHGIDGVMQHIERAIID